MNSRERRRQEADQHNYERWLYMNTRHQRNPKKALRDRVSRTLLPVLAMSAALNVKIIG